MKQTFLQSCATAVILLMLPFTANAQNSKNQNKTAQTVKDQTIDTLAVQGFDKVIKDFNTAVNTQDKSKSRDYKILAKEYNGFYAKYDALPERIKKYYREEKGLDFSGMYYNLACYNARVGNMQVALAAIDSVAKYGTESYSWAMKDEDLASLRGEKKFKDAMSVLREKTDYQHILEQSASYAPDSVKFHFTYANPDDSNLVRVRMKFNLDSIAGNGDEISKIEKLMYWVHNTIRHDGQHGNPSPYNAIDMMESCKKSGNGLNCRGLAMLLNECYLAMGFKSRYVTCFPKVYINDCHVINSVYSNTLHKWIWMDPTFAAFMMDEDFNLLSIEEVRDRFKDGRTVRLNDDANWNGRKESQEAYFNYMSKNLYHIECISHTGFNTETYIKGHQYTPEEYAQHIYMDLCPQNYKSNRTGSNEKETTDCVRFWENPYK
ncbi:MAG: transglutaminase-like domain-containing protein [Bacteroidales bacterium]